MDGHRRGRAVAPARWLSAVTGGALVLWALGTPLAGQTATQDNASISGRLRDSTEVPLGYTTVYLVPRDTSRRSQAALTDSSGAFAFRGLGAGAYYLRVDRVGFEPEWSDAKQLAVGQHMALALTSGAAPVSLSPTVLAGLCRSEGLIQEGTALAVLWREARKTAAARRLFDLSYSYRLDLGERLSVPNSYAHRTARHRIVSTPARARELDRRGAFAGFGVQMDSTRLVAVPELLEAMTDAFARTHCLAILPDRYSEHRIRFEPFVAVSDSTVKDFAGNIVLDDKFRLKRIEFEYRVGDLSISRGVVDFGDGPLHRGPIRFIKKLTLLMFNAPATSSEWLEMDPRLYRTRASLRGTVDVHYGAFSRDTTGF